MANGKCIDGRRKWKWSKEARKRVYGNKDTRVVKKIGSDKKMLRMFNLGYNIGRLEAQALRHIGKDA